MKIALCLSGFARNFEYTYPYLKKFILDPLNPDIFFYGYSQNAKNIYKENILDTYQPKKNVIREWTSSIEDEIWDAYGTREIGQTQLHTSIINIMSMFYNIYKSNELKTMYEEEHNFQYDLVIRARTDLFFCRPINEAELLQAQVPMTVLIPQEWDFRGITGYGVSDHFAIGTSHAINLYSNTFNRLAEYNLEHKFLFHPESMNGYNLHVENVNRIGLEVPHYWFELEHFIDNRYHNFSSSYIDGIKVSPTRK